MRLLFTLSLALVFGAVIAQPVLNLNLSNAIGQRWGYGLTVSSTDEFPLPQEGASLTWDFRGIGALSNLFLPETSDVTFSTATENDFLPVVFEGIDDQTFVGGGTANDSFPEGIGILYMDYALLEDGLEGTVLGQSPSAIELLGYVYKEDGQIEYESSAFTPYFFSPRGMDYTEIRTYQNLDIQYDVIGENTVDTILVRDSIVYVGYGTLQMYYGDVSNVVCYKRLSESIYRTYDVATGQLQQAQTINYTAYAFYDEGNLLPLLEYEYDDFGQVIFGLYVPWPFITNTNAVRSLVLSPRITPNPATAQAQIQYALDEASEVSFALFASDGREVFRQAAGRRTAGAHQETLDVPLHLPAGTYYLHLRAGPRAGVAALSISR